MKIDGSPWRGPLSVVAFVSIVSMLAGCAGPGSSTAPIVGPPSILGWSPGVTRSVPPAAPLTVYFSRAMNRPSVQRAWHLSPHVSGAFHWTATSVAFQPAHPLHPGSYYTLSIGAGARDVQQKAVLNPLSVAFTTGNALAVTSVSPAAGTAGVLRNGLISVSFNHPMVALAGLGTPVAPPAGWDVSISPQTAGHGGWLGTSTWVFYPESGLNPSSNYAVTIRGSTQDAWGDTLGQDMTWRFRTAAPGVLAVSPRNGIRNANPAGSISVAFDQPMDHGSAAAAFSLKAGKSAVSGSVSWQGDTLVFHPSSGLDPRQTYVASVGTNARSENGQATLARPVRWTFNVASPPTVVNSTPKNGSVDSYVNLQVFYSAPMIKTSIDRRLSISPPVPNMITNVYGSKSSNGSNVYNVYGDFQPSATYKVTIAPGARDAYGRAVTAPFTLTFKTGPLDPSLVLYGQPDSSLALSFTPGRVVAAPVQVVNVSRVRYRLFRSNPDQLGNSVSFGSALTLPKGTQVRDATISVPNALNRLQNLGFPLAQANGAPLAPGLYWLGAQTEGTSSSSTTAMSELVLAANTSITLKTGSSRVLAWVTSADTGRPLAGVPVKLLNPDGGRNPVAQTDATGVATFPAQPGGNYPNAMVDDGSHYGLVMSNWEARLNTSYSPLNLNGQYVAPPTGTYAYTDRPIYRPGQPVHFRAILWHDRDGVYSLFGPRTATVDVADFQGHKLYSTRLGLDRFGAVHGTFRLPPGAATGYDTISFGLVGAGSSGPSAFANFVVAEYRKPEFLTSVSTPHTSYVQGQTINATASVKYVFGAPVAGQQVSWTAYRQPSFGQPAGWDQYSFGDQDALQKALDSSVQGEGPQGQFGATMAQGTGTTDDSGRLSIKVPVDIRKQGINQTITIEATTTDINHQLVSGRAAVSAGPASFSIGLAPGAWTIPTGQKETVGVASVSPAGRPIGGRSLTATVYQRTYTSRFSPRIGVAVWKQVPHDKKWLTHALTTDSRGRSSFSFTPRSGGIYYVVVEGADVRGNTARSTVSVFASSAGFSDWGSSSNTSISLKPDRPAYRAGDTAHILVAAPFPNASALVTVERDNVRRDWVRHFRSNSPTVDVPITLDDLPNVYVTVTVYRGWRNGSPPDWRIGATNLRVRLDPKRLVIHLAQNRAHYHPGDRATYTIRTTDAQGKPVSAQLSLALVDSAVLALQSDINPNIVTGLYGDRQLNVTTSSQGVVSIDHLQQRPGFRVTPPGGLGGGGGGPPPVTARLVAHAQSGKVRHIFKDTAYWSAHVLTDASGAATVKVTLPDNLTTWRLDARGITLAQQVGSATLNTVSTQDIILRPVTPRFLLQGDSLQLGTVVNNNLDQPVDADVSLTAAGLSLPSGTTNTVTIPAHGERLVLWNVSVPESSAAILTLRASPSTSGVQGDAVQVTIPVHPPLTDETVATAGQVYGSVKQAVIVPAGARPEPGALTVQISAAITAGMGRAFAGFAPSPFDSNEDIANRLTAAAALHSVPPALSGLSPKTYSRLPSRMQKDIATLTKNQLPDGGWPWFNGPGAKSDPMITADVAMALADAGVGQVSGGVLDRVDRYLQKAKVPQGVQDYVALAETRVAGLRRGVVAQIAVGNRSSGSDALSIANTAWALTIGSGNHTSAQSLASQLDSQALVSATGAHWEAPGRSAVEVTSHVLNALVASSPQDPFIPAAARWLMLARQGDSWNSARNSAQALSALAAYARAASEGTASYQYTVEVNGSQKLGGAYTNKTVRKAPVVAVPVGALGRGKQSSLVIARQPANGNLGPGPMYYVASLRYFLQANNIAARNQGISISRRYLDRAGNPITSVPAGSVVQVELTLTAPQTLSFLDVADAIPAGFEPIDQSLQTSQQGLFAGWQGTSLPSGVTDLSPYLDHTDVRDDRISLYASSLPPGTYRYTYLTQATVSGQYTVAPSHAEEAFFPEVFGRSAGTTFTVR